MESIYQKEVTAKKDHVCNGCQIYLSEYNWNDFTFSQKKELIPAVKDGMKIKKGQTYLRCTVVGFGEIWTFRVRIDIHEFLVKHGIYEEVNQYLN